MRTSVLADHRRVKSKLITPFNDKFGPLHEVSWVNTMIPELLWIALIQEQHGARRGVEIITAFTRDIRASHAERTKTIWAAVGKFDAMASEELCNLVEIKGAAYVHDLRVALQPLVAWYPSCPLHGLFAGKAIQPQLTERQSLKTLVEKLFDRTSLTATWTQATAIWLAFDADRLKVGPDLALAQFPKIEDYPRTEISRKIAASIRAALNSFFDNPNLMASGSVWATYFWNRGFEIEPCEDQ